MTSLCNHSLWRKLTAYVESLCRFDLQSDIWECILRARELDDDADKERGQ
jgi:hypothetical protein